MTRGPHPVTGAAFSYVWGVPAIHTQGVVGCNDARIGPKMIGPPAAGADRWPLFRERSGKGAETDRGFTTLTVPVNPFPPQSKSERTAQGVGACSRSDARSDKR